MMSHILQYPIHTQFSVSIKFDLKYFAELAEQRAWAVSKTETTKSLKQVTAFQIWKNIFWFFENCFEVLKFVFFKVFKWRFCFENARRYDAVTLPSSTDFKLSATVDTKLTIEIWKIVKMKSFYLYVFGNLYPAAGFQFPATVLEGFERRANIIRSWTTMVSQKLRVF